MVAITGQVRTDAIGSDAFQEADITGITRPITKHNFLVKDVKELRRTMQEAFYIATTGRPGPVLVDIPVDVQRALTEWTWEDKIEMRSYKPTIKGHPMQIKRAAEMIKEAKRPLLYVGGGTILSGASAELKALAEKGNIPGRLDPHGQWRFPSGSHSAHGTLGDAWQIQRQYCHAEIGSFDFGRRAV